MHSSSDGFRYNPIGDVVSNGLRCQFSSGQPRSFSTSVPLFDDITIKFKSQITNTLGIQTNPYISFSSTSFLSLHVYNYPCTGKAYDLGLIYRNVNLG